MSTSGVMLMNVLFQLLFDILAKRQLLPQSIQLSVNPRSPYLTRSSVLHVNFLHLGPLVWGTEAFQDSNRRLLKSSLRAHTCRRRAGHLSDTPKRSAPCRYHICCHGDDYFFPFACHTHNTKGITTGYGVDDEFEGR